LHLVVARQLLLLLPLARIAGEAGQLVRREERVLLLLHSTIALHRALLRPVLICAVRPAKGLHDAKGSIRPHHLQTLAGIGVAAIAAATKRIVTVVGGALKPAKAVTVVLRHV
jgi:hypothetical protein